MNGFCGDCAYTFCVGEVDPEVMKLLRVTKESLYKGIENAVHGKRLGDIGFAVQQHCESHSYGVVREFVGHGIGKEMHEEPQVPNYGRKRYRYNAQERYVHSYRTYDNAGKPSNIDGK